MAVVVTLVWGLPVVSQAEPMTTFFNDGTMDFSFTGSLAGGFSADGSVADATQFPVDEDGACVAYYITSDIPGAEVPRRNIRLAPGRQPLLPGVLGRAPGSRSSAVHAFLQGCERRRSGR